MQEYAKAPCDGAATKTKERGHRRTGSSITNVEDDRKEEGEDDRKEEGEDDRRKKARMTDGGRRE